MFLARWGSGPPDQSSDNPPFRNHFCHTLVCPRTSRQDNEQVPSQPSGPLHSSDCSVGFPGYRGRKKGFGQKKFFSLPYPPPPAQHKCRKATAWYGNYIHRALYITMVHIDGAVHFGYRLCLHIIFFFSCLTILRDEALKYSLFNTINILVWEYGSSSVSVRRQRDAGPSARTWPTGLS